MTTTAIFLIAAAFLAALIAFARCEVLSQTIGLLIKRLDAAHARADALAIRLEALEIAHGCDARWDIDGPPGFRGKYCERPFGHGGKHCVHDGHTVGEWEDPPDDRPRNPRPPRYIGGTGT